MAIYPTFKLYLDEDGDGNPTNDHSAHAVSDVSGQYGIFTDRDTDRLANVGSVSFVLDNHAELYSADVNFSVGTAISLTVTDGTTERQVFAGRISNINIDTGDFDNKRVRVTAEDWMSLANKARVTDLPVATFLTANNAFPYLLALMSKTPERTDYDGGTETFANVFDGLLPRTAVYSELDKLTKSELGYLYLKHKTSDYGVTLRFENRLSRGSTRPLDKVPTGLFEPGYLKYHGPAGASGYLKYHGPAGASGKIRIDAGPEAVFDNLHVSGDLTKGDNIINKFTVTNVPRNTDTTVKVLYTLGAPITVGAAAKMSVSGNFSDPTGGGTVIRAFDVVTPVIYVDYDLNSKADGTGTDLTSNMVVLFGYGTNGFTFAFRNNGPEGYLIILNVRGKGIYKYNPVELISENEESIGLFGEIEDTFRREYSEDTNTSQYFANSITAINRYSLNNLKRVDFVANTSDFLMAAFLFLDVGSKVRVIEDFPALDNRYYIQGIKFSLGLDNILKYSWYLKRAAESILQPIAVRGTTGSTLKRNALDYGILPHLSNMLNYSISLWIKTDAGDIHTFGQLISRNVDTGSGRRGWEVEIDTNGSIKLYAYKTPTDGVWEGVYIIPNDGNWHHLVITYDNSTVTTDPAMWVDGVSQTVNETSTPAGDRDPDGDCSLILFSNGRDPTIPAQEYEAENKLFTLKDVRVYNKILSTAEIAELYAGEDDYTTVQDSLQFNGIFAPRDLINDYINDPILADDIVLETVTMAAGTPYNEDTSDPDYILRGEAL